MNEKQVEANESLIKDVKRSSGKDSFEALEKLAKNYRPTPILIPSFLVDRYRYKCVGLFDKEGEEDRKKREKDELDSLAREELSMIMKAEEIKLFPVKISSAMLEYKLVGDLSRNYQTIAINRITNEINCGNNNPKALLRQYDFSNEKYPYIIRAKQDSEISAIEATGIPRSVAVEQYLSFLIESFKKDYVVPSSLRYAYETCRDVRNEMVINQINAKQVIENNSSAISPNGDRFAQVKIICPYLLDR